MNHALTHQTNQSGVLPCWAYLALAVACLCMGLWASYITLQYFEHGAKALETDKALQALAVAAALMFVASEMAAFGMAAVLTERQLRARSRMLTGFAAAVLTLEVWTIVAVQMALTSGADLTQTTVQTQEKDLRARIALIEADAAAKRATADQQRATAKTAYELHLAGKSSDKAAAEQAKTTALYDELKAVQAQKRPTLTGLMGEKTALFYAVVRGVLVSLAGLVFFGTAGALLRAARGGAQSVDHQLLALLHELRGTPIHAALQAQAVAPAAPAELASLRNSASSAAQSPVPAAPAQDGLPIVTSSPSGIHYNSTAALIAAAAPIAHSAPAPAPAGVPTGLNYSGMAALAGAGALASLAAPMAHSAPAVPAAGGVSKPVHADVSKPIHAQDVQQGSADAPKAAPAVQETALADVSETIHADVSKPIQQKTLKPRVKRAVSAKLDTGTDGKAGARYKRIKAGVLAGKIRPSVRGIQAVEGGSQEVVADYLQQLENEGVTVRHGRGWVLAQKGGAA